MGLAVVEVECGGGQVGWGVVGIVLICGGRVGGWSGV
jgi:hypothetical protein